MILQGNRSLREIKSTIWRTWASAVTFYREKNDLGFSAENIVFFELLRRGYKVAVGKYQNTEVDFVVEKQGTFTYIQVTADITAKDTFDREMKPLYAIRDNYEKIVLTLDKLTLGNYDGIRVINVLDWLLGDEA